MASSFKLTIVTPDRSFFEDEVEEVIVSGTEGDLGILRDHTPLVTGLKIGRVKIKQKGKYKEAALSSGYVRITEEEVTIVTDSGEWPEEIDVERAKAAKKRAEERLDKKNDPDIDTLRAEIALRKSLNRIKISERYMA